MTNENKILVNIVSFGYKYGVPEDSDLVYNVRFLPNPYYIPEMKSRTGVDSDVYDYVMSFDETKQFFKKLKERMDRAWGYRESVLPGFQFLISGNV